MMDAKRKTQGRKPDNAAVRSHQSTADADVASATAKSRRRVGQIFTKSSNFNPAVRSISLSASSSQSAWHAPPLCCSGSASMPEKGVEQS